MKFINFIIRKFWNTIGYADNIRIKKQFLTNEIVQKCDIYYNVNKSKFNSYDLYFSKKYNKKIPIIIDIHGGGWIYGKKEVNKPFCFEVAKMGFAVFNINYRLVPDVTFDVQVKDVLCAIEHIFEFAKTSGYDTNNVFICADSAGAHIAMVAYGIINNEKICVAYNSHKINIKIKAMGLYSPVLHVSDRDKLWEENAKVFLGTNYKSLPYSKYLNFESIINISGFPPCFLASSIGDTLAAKQTREVEKYLKEKNIDTKLEFVEGILGFCMSHCYIVNNPLNSHSKNAINHMCEFFYRYV